MGGGLYAWGCTNLTLKNMDIGNFTEAGISTDTCTEIYLQSPMIRKGSVGISAVNTAALTVQEGTIGWNHDVGLKVAFSSDITITNSTLPYNDLHSISVMETDGVVIRGVCVRGAYRNGVSITDSTAISISDSQARECSIGISLTGCSQFLVQNNTLSYNYEIGLMIDSCLNGIVWDLSLIHI